MVTASQKNILLKELFLQAVEGNRHSYEKFLNEIAKIIRIIIAKKVPSSDLEDVVQEVLISVHKARHTYDGARPIMPWLMAIIKYRVGDYLRKYYAQMRNQTSNIDEVIDMLLDVTKEDENHELIDEIFSFVEPKQKEILTMMYIQGYTAKETASRLGMNESAVKVAAHRAIKKIKTNFPK